jgi:Ca2+-binding RTX toxin-like protein
MLGPQMLFNLSGSSIGASNCAWSPNGRRIAYVHGTFSNGALVQEKADNTGSRQLLTPDIPDHFDGNPDWAPVYPALCRGVPATIVGTGGNDTLVGTDARDVVASFSGNDSVNLRKGNDLACLGSGNDTAHGRQGKDVIWGSSHNDRLFGEEGADTLEGGPGSDVCVGGLGVDVRHGCEQGSGS